MGQGRWRGQGAGVRYGGQIRRCVPTSPVLHAGDIRLLPQTLTGLIFDNTSIAGLKIEGGKLTASSDRSGVNHSGDPGHGLRWSLDRGRITAQYIGADYRFNDNWSFKLHTSRLDNVWNQSFARVDFKQRLTPTITWDTGLNYYRTRDSGDALLGKIDNDSWSTHLGLNVGFNRFLLAYEQVRGDSPFDYVWNTYDLELDNASQWSDFNNPNERSWQASYTYDFAGLGLPGLSLTAVTCVVTTSMAREQRAATRRSTASVTASTGSVISGRATSFRAARQRT